MQSPTNEANHKKNHMGNSCQVTGSLKTTILKALLYPPIVKDPGTLRGYEEHNKVGKRHRMLTLNLTKH